MRILGDYNANFRLDLSKITPIRFLFMCMLRTYLYNVWLDSTSSLIMLMENPLLNMSEMKYFTIEMHICIHYRMCTD